MKLVAVALLILGTLCNAVLAAAEDPVPFKALMQTAGAQPSLPPMTDARDQSTAVSTQPAHRQHMTTGTSTMLAMAEGPVPFRALMETAGAQPGLPPMTDARDQSAALSTQPAHRPMTSGGKIMTGVGIAICVIGGSVLVGTAAARNAWGFSSSDEAKLLGAGSGAVAGGAILIVLGYHRRSPQ